jgi:hypothetical protein
MSNTTGGYQPPSTSTTGAAGSMSGNSGTTTDTAKNEAANVGQTAKEAGGQVASTAADQAKQVAGETKRQAKDLINQAQSQVKEQAGAQKDKASTGLRSLADELRSIADGNAPQNGMTSDLARQAADKAGDIASWIEQRDAGSLLDEVRQLARRKPGAFLIGAALAGVAAGRLTRGVVAAQGSQGSQGFQGSGDSVYVGNTYPTDATYSTTTEGYGTTSAMGMDDTLTGADATGIRNPESGPLVVEPERIPARQSPTGTGLGMEEDRR